MERVTTLVKQNGVAFQGEKEGEQKAMMCECITYKSHVVRCSKILNYRGRNLKNLKNSILRSKIILKAQDNTSNLKFGRNYNTGKSCDSKDSLKLKKNNNQN